MALEQLWQTPGRRPGRCPRGAPSGSPAPGSGRPAPQFACATGTRAPGSVPRGRRPWRATPRSRHPCRRGHRKQRPLPRRTSAPGQEETTQRDRQARRAAWSRHPLSPRSARRTARAPEAAAALQGLKARTPRSARPAAARRRLSVPCRAAPPQCQAVRSGGRRPVVHARHPGALRPAMAPPMGGPRPPSAGTPVVEVSLPVPPTDDLRHRPPAPRQAWHRRGR
mmetsp:Transcript_48685/g.155571  ORF Transcript_48685/g.155571 Transcript_48685/m.155571 type:complete len:224 (-) Transcript_48685:700-1371(-)